MAADLEAPDVGHLINGPCDDPRVQESHIRAMIAIAKWTEAATERINATPEWQARLCAKVDELRNMLREQLAVREGFKESILKIQLEIEYMRKDLALQKAWQDGHDTRQVRREDIKDQRLWELVKPMLQLGVPIALAMYGAHMLGWFK